MTPINGSTSGRAGGFRRRYPGGTENAIILATVRGSIPNRRAASRRLKPSIWTAWRTLAYNSSLFIPRPLHTLHTLQRATCCRIFTPAQPDNPAASLGDFVSGAYKPELMFCGPAYPEERANEIIPLWRDFMESA